MAQKHRSRPAGDGTARKNVSFDGLDTSENSRSLLDAQASRIAFRFRLPPYTARLVAGLAFGRHA